MTKAEMVSGASSFTSETITVATEFTLTDQPTVAVGMELKTLGGTAITTKADVDAVLSDWDVDVPAPADATTKKAVFECKCWCSSPYLEFHCSLF